MTICDILVFLAIFGLANSQNTTNSGAIDCFAARDEGQLCDGKSSSRMFYYLPTMGTCQPFTYYGCGGNSNKFSTAQECRSRCSNAQQQRDSSSTDVNVQMKNACSAKYDTDHLTPVRCSSGAMSCPQGHTCTNSFCCPQPAYLCNLTYDSGKFAEHGSKSDKYFWVPKYSVCMRFSFYGTLGNANNFPNYNTCMSTCANLSSTTTSPRTNATRSG